jgi:hypothetical protein
VREEATTSAVGIRVLDFAIIANCVISFVLCTRALYRAQVCDASFFLYWTATGLAELIGR